MTADELKKITVPKSNRLCKLEKIAFYGGADLPDDHPVCQAALKLLLM